MADRVFDSDAFVLQLHAKRYDTVSSLVKVFAQSAITLNSGALGIMLTGQIFGAGSEGVPFRAMACFAAGLVCALVAVGVMYFTMMAILNDRNSYVEVGAGGSGLAPHIGKVRAASFSFGLSIFFFVAGVLSASAALVEQPG